MPAKLRKRRKKSAEPLEFKRESRLHELSAAEARKMESYCGDYLEFLSKAKTERLAYREAERLALENGYRHWQDGDQSEKLKAGDRIVMGCRGKTILLAHLGRKPLQEGLRIIGGHTDAPRIDAKPVPLYEDGGMALVDTHYYGGIRKHQWVAMPLAMHGVVIKQSGEQVDISIGEAPGEPVFSITDLLPHLARKQGEKKLNDAFSGEDLNVLIGSSRQRGKKRNDEEGHKKKIKAHILALLHERYGITEEDLVSAEIEFVPAGPARELGLDRSMLIGYGHDDRICAYAGLRALLDLKKTPETTAVVLMCDKEEIGSVGATGMDSTFFENAIAEMIAAQETPYSDILLRRSLAASRMISADVAALHDPNYPDVSSPNNMPHINAGMVLTRYTGARGKSGASEASAEFTAEIRAILNQAGVVWQTGELGKVDLGGGGTIAKFLARYGMDVIDSGVGLLSMHAPWEIASKFDAYMTYKGYHAFFKA